MLNLMLEIHFCWFKYPSSESFSVSENSEIIGDPECAELQHEGEQSWIRFVVENRELLDGGHVVDPGDLLVGRRLELGQVEQDLGDVRHRAVVNQRSGRVLSKKLNLRTKNYSNILSSHLIKVKLLTLKKFFSSLWIMK